MQTDIKWPAADLDAMQRQMRRVVDELGKPVDDAVTMAAAYLARSAAAKTRKAPKKRRTYVNRQKTGKLNRHRFPYYREVWRQGKTFKWFIREKSDPKYLDITRAGLAKQSWRWMIPWVKRSGSNFAAEVHRRRSTFDLEIEMANKLEYILSALKPHEAEAILGDAMARAARAMERSINNKLKRMQQP